MATRIETGVVDHLRLTVSDLGRAREFYTQVLGFRVAAELPPGVLLTNGSIILGLGPPPNAERAIGGDRFDENRVGLDHLSFKVHNREELEQAERFLDEHGVPHGEIEDNGPAWGLYTLMFRDPDNIQLEMTAPYS
jgi:glyoxylase I family protein